MSTSPHIRLKIFFQMTQNFSIAPTITPTSDTDNADTILQNLEQLRIAVTQLQAANIELERLKDQSLMCIQQYTNDIESLKAIQKRFKSLILQKKKQTQQAQIAPIPEYPTIPPPQTHVPQITEPPMQSPDPLSKKDLEWTCLPSEYQNTALKLKYCISASSVLCTVEFNQDGSLFAFADGKTLFIMSTSDGSLVATGSIPFDESKSGEQHTRILAFSPDSKYIALAGHNNDVIVYQVQNPRDKIQILREHTNNISSLTFSSDSKLLYSGGFDGLICVWDLQQFVLRLKKSPPPGSNEDHIVVDLSLAHDESFLAVGFMNGTVALYRPETLEPITNEPIRVYNKNNLLGLALSYDDNYLATAGQDHTASLWSLVGKPRQKQTFTGHEDLVITVCFSPDGDMVLSGSKDESLKGWNTKTGSCLFTIKAHQNTLFRVNHHPTENCFISCAGDGKVCVWEYNPVWQK